MIEFIHKLFCKHPVRKEAPYSITLPVGSIKPEETSPGTHNICTQCMKTLEIRMPNGSKITLNKHAPKERLTALGIQETP